MRISSTAAREPEGRSGAWYAATFTSVNPEQAVEARRSRRIWPGLRYAETFRGAFAPLDLSLVCRHGGCRRPESTAAASSFCSPHVRAKRSRCRSRLSPPGRTPRLDLRSPLDGVLHHIARSMTPAVGTWHKASSAVVAPKLVHHEGHRRRRPIERVVVLPPANRQR
jgi:hypothetical protein